MSNKPFVGSVRNLHGREDAAEQTRRSQTHFVGIQTLPELWSSEMIKCNILARQVGKTGPYGSKEKGFIGVLLCAHTALQTLGFF